MPVCLGARCGHERGGGLVNNIFHISFDTKDMPGKIKAVRVTLDQEIVAVGADKTFDISLAAHPLYPQLEQYVLANPSKKRGGPGGS